MSSEIVLDRKTQLSDQLLEEFAFSFFGYGNLDAPLWFIGMEEGGGDSFDGVAANLEMWKKLGKTTTLDIRASADDPDRHEHAEWFVEHPGIQSTWNPLIRLLLAYWGEDPTTEDVRRYQRDELAGSDANECLLELLPLPSPSTSDWYYSDWSSMPWVRSREVYKNYLLPRRIERLQSLVTRHEPEAVIFYSKSYLDYCCEVAGSEAEEFDEVDLPRKEEETLSAFIRRGSATTFVVTYHPRHRPATNRYFESVGRLLAARS